MSGSAACLPSYGYSCPSCGARFTRLDAWTLHTDAQGCVDPRFDARFELADKTNGEPRYRLAPTLLDDGGDRAA